MPPLFRSLSILLSGLLLCGCASFAVFPAPPLLQGAYPDGSPRYRIEQNPQGRKHGAERWWHENGTLQLEASYQDGKRDGAYRAWHVDGTPWYAGRDSLGVPVDTLRFWFPNGRLQSLSVFTNGAVASLETFDSSGLTAEALQARAEEEQRADSLEEIETVRQADLAEWTLRARATVETYWALPESMKKTPRRAVASIRVRENGTIQAVAWPEKSGSPEFNRLAARALTKARKFPPLPDGIAGPLELRYEFTTPGVAPPRRRLKLHDPDSAFEEREERGE